MPNNYSIMGLHLCYRLWIAELNSDVTVLRIFDDYLKDLKSKNDGEAVKTEIDHFEKQFISVRSEIDGLTHDMHLIKMELAAQAKEGKPEKKNPIDEVHGTLQKKYDLFRGKFDKLKKDFIHFENKWLQ